MLPGWPVKMTGFIMTLTEEQRRASRSGWQASNVGPKEMGVKMLFTGIVLILIGWAGLDAREESDEESTVGVLSSLSVPLLPLAFILAAFKDFMGATTRFKRHPVAYSAILLGWMAIIGGVVSLSWFESAQL